MARPRRHLRWGEPRRTPRAKFARVPRPVDGGAVLLRPRCLRAMAQAVALAAGGATVSVCAALPGVRVVARREVDHG